MFVKSSHPLSGKTSVHYGELQRYPYVTYDRGKYKNSSLFTEEMSDNVVSDKHIVISDRATLMNMLLKTDCYTVGTGIMPSDLNDGKIISIPIVTDEEYSVGYVVKRNRVNTKMAEQFISLLNSFSSRYISKKKP